MSRPFGMKRLLPLTLRGVISDGISRPSGVRISFFISTQTVAGLIGSLVLGRIADRFGSLRVIQSAAMFVLFAPTLSLMLTFLPDLAPLILQAILLVIYFVVGFSENVIVLG